MVLTFTCNNCHAHLTKHKIMRHYCLNLSTNKVNNVIDDQSIGSEITKNRLLFGAMTFSNQEWSEFVATSLIKHETDNDNLRLVLNGLRFRKNFPRKEKKFYNYINAFLPSKNVPDCAKIIWNIVTNKLKEHIADVSSVTKSVTSVEKESNSLQKRKLDSDLESNNDVPEEKKAKLSDNILPVTVSTEIENIAPSDKIDVLEQNANDLSENISVHIANAPEIDKVILNINENPNPEVIQSEKVVQPDVLVASIEKVIPNNDRSLNRNFIWKEKAMERLSNYETQDENMKSVINALKYKKFLPQREDKFNKLLGTIPKTRKIKDCHKILWSIINGQYPEKVIQNIPQQPAIELLNPQLDNDLLTINGSVESVNAHNVNVKLVSENKEETKSVTVEPVSQNKESINVMPVVNISKPSNLIINEIQERRRLKFRNILTAEEWHLKVMEALNKYQTVDTDLLILIARLKTRTNIPQKFIKFKNFIHNMPLSHKIANCADLLWNIILPGNPDTSKTKLDAFTSEMPILKCMESIKHD